MEHFKIICRILGDIQRIEWWMEQFEKKRSKNDIDFDWRDIIKTMKEALSARKSQEKLKRNIKEPTKQVTNVEVMLHEEDRPDMTAADRKMMKNLHKRLKEN
jgi:hypothetical protein